MRVWRVEDKETRQGPYTLRSSGIDSCSSNRQPMPYTDGLGYSDGFPENYRYGFTDLKKLKAWFNEKERKAMAKNGFVCRIYEVPKKHVKEGRKQAVFSVDRAKLVRKSKVL